MLLDCLAFFFFQMATCKNLHRWGWILSEKVAMQKRYRYFDRQKLLLHGCSSANPLAGNIGGGGMLCTTHLSAYDPYLLNIHQPQVLSISLPVVFPDIPCNRKTILIFAGSQDDGYKNWYLQIGSSAPAMCLFALCS